MTQKLKRTGESRESKDLSGQINHGWFPLLSSIINFMHGRIAWTHGEFEEN